MIYGYNEGETFENDDELFVAKAGHFINSNDEEYGEIEPVFMRV